MLLSTGVIESFCISFYLYKITAIRQAPTQNTTKLNKANESSQSNKYNST